MKLVQCPACGATNLARAGACKGCGAPLAATAAGPDPATTLVGRSRQATDATGPLVITVGRAPDNDVVLAYPFVSAHHARITVEAGQAVIEDLGSVNGIGIGDAANKVTSAPLAESDTVYFGTLPVPASRLLGGALRLGGATAEMPALTRTSTVFGRDPSCDHVLPHPEISRRHARIVRTAAGLLIEDLGSTNGTFVNGQRITKPVPLRDGDTVAMGAFTYRIAADGTMVEHAWHDNVTVEARGIAVDIPGGRLLDGVSLTVFPSELVGVMGPSGAGKTTLLSALNGYAPPAEGKVLYNGQDLYATYDLFRLQLGYVPQDDIMHRDLTVSQALYYTARLRLPADTSDAEIRERIARVLDQLGLRGVEDTRIGTPERRGLSGGERKRVNVAMELLTDPSVLFLDEPTSGLSSEDALTVMRVLRALADAGKTVIVTVHQPSRDVFELFHQVAVVGRDAPGESGRLVYFGPAFPDAIAFFDPAAASRAGSPRDLSPDRLLRGMATAPADEWVRRFERSDTKRRYVDDRAGSVPAVGVARGSAGPRRRRGLGQWWTLVRRSAAVKAGDRENFLMLLVQAPAIALFTAMVFGPQARDAITHASWLQVAAPTGGALFMLVVAAVWLGCSNAAREIVAEWAIYRRERMVNLTIPAYLFSKLTVLGGLSVVQCLVLVGGIFLGCGCRAPLLPTLGICVLVALVGLGCGLVLSSLSASSEVAISLVPTVLLPMIMFGGAFVPLAEMSAPAAAAAQAMPTRWAFEGVVLLENQQWPLWEVPALVAPAPAKRETREFVDRYFSRRVRTSVGTDAVVLSGMLVVLLAAVALTLRARDVV